MNKSFPATQNHHRLKRLLAAAALAVAFGPLAMAQEATLTLPLCVDGETPPEQIKQMILDEAARQQADTKLALAVAGQESGYGARVNSKAGARGPMQLMPATAVRYGVADICDARENIRGGVSYLKDLMTMFGGNVMLVVAAYNAGENRIIATRGIPSIAETVSYTARVTNAYYGFDNAIAARSRAAKSSASVEGSQTTGVDLLAATVPTATASDKPIPINQTPDKARLNSWIGGSVLYVQ
ncbi:lytic transglycosylase domain-containing protein [Rhizobium hainanense]|uniref:Transglycosylase SLT domain-containing protein n=1 Tax=Rhizobium hainanense TaxID=52131 RepID=A0A1C3WKF9_9HYPH|nr:lytic transglycosylase domain-containing protein [Rhizobium hainanense]SCB40491.1 Transglycosylase SLT domain-containing protein [Rhizobium hainanense]